MNQDTLSPDEIAYLHATFETVPYAKLLGMGLGELGRGEASVHLDVRHDLKQNRGVVHGGAIASLLDTAAAFAAVTILEPGERVTTTDLTIHYLRPVGAGRLTARAKIIRSGRRISVLSAEVFDSNKTIVATAVTGYIRLT